MAGNPTARSKRPDKALHKTIRIAVVQIESHPAITVEHTDYLSEPFLTFDEEAILSKLQRFPGTRDIFELKSKIREKYLAWAAGRIEGIFAYLEAMGESEKPHIIIFPEFSIPFELLHIVAKHVRSSNLNDPAKVSSMNDWVVVAGNHAYDRCHEEYLRAFNDPLDPDSVDDDGFALEPIPEHLEGAANSVLVIIAPPRKSICVTTKVEVVKERRHVESRFKWKLSPFEFTSIHKESLDFSISADDRDRWCCEFNLDHETVYKINVFLCSEALQGMNTETTAQIGVICAYHSRPEEFRRFIEPTIRKQQLAVLASDGCYGGSSISCNFDRRFSNWWNQSPFNGTLPKGDAILVYETPLVPSSSSIGSVNPYKLDKLIRVSPIIPDSTGDDQFKASVELSKAIQKLRSSARSSSREKHVMFARKLDEVEMRYQLSPVQKVQFAALRLHAEAGQLNQKVLDTIASNCVYTRIVKKQETDPIRSRPSKSLATLEQDFASLAHAWLRHKAESGVLHPETSKAIIEAQRRCLEKFRGSRQLGPLPAVRELFREFSKQTKRRAFSNLNRILGTIIERFSASSGWLFLYRPSQDLEPGGVGGRLDEIISHNVPLTHHRVSFPIPSTGNNSGITVKAFVQKSGVLENDVLSGPNHKIYYKELTSTKSILAVPIFDVDMRSVKGVLTLECDRFNAFLPCHVGELQAATWSFLPDLLIVEATKDPETSNAWHPEIHGWGLSTLLAEISEEVSTSLLEVGTIQSLSCSIWHSDWPKRYMFVRGTARFNFEYVSEKVLPLSSGEAFEKNNHQAPPEGSWMRGLVSFSGTVAQAAQGRVFRNLISDEPTFTHSAKAERMGAAYLVSTPIYAGSVNGTDSGDPNKAKSSGVLSLYFFKRQHPRYEFSIEGIFPDHDVALLARMIGKRIEDTKGLRSKVSSATLLARLNTQGVVGIDLMEHMRHEVLRLIGADFCTIFHGTLPDSDRRDVSLKVLSTTGLNSDVYSNCPDGKCESIGFECSDNPEGWTEISGLTAFLAFSRSGVLRKVDVTDPWEMGCWSPGPDSVPLEKEGKYIETSRMLFRPANFLNETAVPTDSDHRRFLGCSVRVSDGSSGIIRVLRKSGDRPFVEADGEMLLALAELFKPFFDPPDARKLVAKEWLMRADDGKCNWNRRFVGAILQFLLISAARVHSSLCFDNICIRVRSQDGMRRSILRFYQGHSSETTQAVPPRVAEKVFLEDCALESEALSRVRPCFATWSSTTGASGVEIDEFIYTPISTNKSGRRCAYMVPFVLGGYGKAPDALLIFEGADPKFGDPVVKRTILDGLQRVAAIGARRLTCLSRFNLFELPNISGHEVRDLSDLVGVWQGFIELVAKPHGWFPAEEIGDNQFGRELHPWFGNIPLTPALFVRDIELKHSSETESTDILKLWREFLLQSVFGDRLFESLNFSVASVDRGSAHLLWQ